MAWSDKRKLLLILAFFGVCFYFLGSSGGVGTFQREDRTGSPLSLNSSCGTCHYGGNFQSSLVLNFNSKFGLIYSLLHEPQKKC